MQRRREGVSIAVTVLVGIIVVLAVSTIAIIAIGTLTVAGSSSSTSQSTLTVTTTTSSSSTSGIPSTTSSTTSTTTTGTETGNSTSAESQYGLEVQLSINAIQVPTGGTIQVNIAELNTLNHENNVSKSGDYAVPVAISSCPNTSILPFGIALYKGYYTAQNVSLGTQLTVFPPTVCPQYERLVTGYLFQPQSDIATVLPGSGLTTMSASVDVVNGTQVGSGQQQPLDPGLYTVVAADEWGGLAILYFQIQGLP